MEEILKKLASMQDDMETHHWKDDNIVYGGITFGEFKAIFKHLIRTADIDTTQYQYYLD